MARIGVDLGGTKIEAALMADDGHLTLRRRRRTPAGDYEATLTQVVDLVTELEVAHGTSCQVGVAHPGAVSPATGLIKNANSTCLLDHDLKSDLQSRLAREVRLANDADCFALSEAVDGAAMGASPVFGVILGTGVGGGVVVDGKLLHGPNAIAGEWGHNPLPGLAGDEHPGPACYCGRRGCIETFLSGPGLVADHLRATATTRLASIGASDPAPAPPTAAQVVALADTGDTDARDSVSRYEQRLARGLASVINIIDPEVIVLGGGLSKITGLYKSVPRLWPPFIFTDRVATRLLPPAHGDAGGVRGAAWLWPE
jgi:fructokinase